MYGLVVYTGSNTKIMLNKDLRKMKYGFTYKITNYFFLASFCVDAILALISMIVLIAKSKEMYFLLEIFPKYAENIRVINYIILYS